MKSAIVLLSIAMLSACATTPQNIWRVALAHDAEGKTTTGSRDNLISALRAGCALRVGWGARRQADPARTIEHVAEPVWVAIRDSDIVEVQLDSFFINLSVIGEPPDAHKNRAPYGGVERAVMWRANLKTDGTFNAVWYDPATGEFVTRVPQRHPIRWFVDCEAPTGTPLYPDAD